MEEDKKPEDSIEVYEEAGTTFTPLEKEVIKQNYVPNLIGKSVIVLDRESGEFKEVKVQRIDKLKGGFKIIGKEEASYNESIEYKEPTEEEKELYKRVEEINWLNKRHFDFEKTWKAIQEDLSKKQYTYPLLNNTPNTTSFPLSYLTNKPTSPLSEMEQDQYNWPLSHISPNIEPIKETESPFPLEDIKKQIENIKGKNVKEESALDIIERQEKTGIILQLETHLKNAPIINLNDPIIKAELKEAIDQLLKEAEKRRKLKKKENRKWKLTLLKYRLRKFFGLSTKLNKFKLGGRTFYLNKDEDNRQKEFNPNDLHLTGTGQSPDKKNILEHPLTPNEVYKNKR